jgi:hypothetical protein
MGSFDLQHWTRIGAVNRRSADSLVREFLDLGSRGLGGPRSGATSCRDGGPAFPAQRLDLVATKA